MNDEGRYFEQRVKATLDESAVNLDASVRRKLASIRVQALSQRQPRLAWRFSGPWVPATVLAFGAVFAFVLLFSITDGRHDDMLAKREDQAVVLDMMASEDGLEGEADPAFYVWLDDALATEGAEHAG